MTPINRKSEIETQTEDVKISNNKLPLFKRMFSVESTTSNVTGITNYYNLPTYINEYSICSCLITFKLIELIISILCICLYWGTIIQLENVTYHSIMYPNVVYCNSIIVNSVVIFSALLGYYINQLILRTFNSILLVLLFVCGCITAQIWYNNDENLSDTSILLLVQTILAFINFLLYIVDVVLSIRNMIQ